MKNMVIRIVLMLALCRGVASLTQRRADIKLENNGYTGILIGVSDDVVPSQKFLDGLERTLADFSDNLFNSTKRRAYLNQITVALPPTWDHFNFSNISSTTEFPTATSKQTIEWANIIVGGQNPSYSDAPYTRQTGECGEPGDYIHLTEKFVTDSAYTTIAFGDVGKLLVREWGHLRWGLFDESGSSDESPTKLFYHGMDGSLHPTRCSAQIEGKPQDAVTGGMCQIGLDTDLPSDTCLFMPDRVQPVGVTGSVMFMHSLPQITEFCDDTADTPDGAKHNAEAPNKQNAMCNGRSAWAVMREHKDFNDGGRERNPSVPAEQARNTRPSIKYVVQRPKEVVFVIDVSTRENVDKVDELRQAVGNYIMNQVQLGTRVGVVTFATTASIVAPLTQVMNETSRGWLVSQLYNDSLALSSTKVGARGATSIGSGLAAAINLISQTGDGTTLDCAEGKENCDQDATALIEEACSYYEQWGKLSNEHVIQYIKMFPERSFTDLETTCKNSQLISDSSSGGDGSDIDPTGDGSSSKVVQDACVNYVANKDFTAAQLTSLNKLFPEKSFTQLTQLCSENDGSELISDNSGRISGDGSNSGISDASTSEVVSEACNYYSKFDDFTAEHISALKTVYPEKTLKQFMQLCSDRNGDAQSELISDTSDASGDGSRPSNGDAISSKVFQEACSYYSSNDDFTTQQLVDLKKLFPGSSLNSLIKLCEQESGSQDELISDTDHNGASNPDNKGDGDQFVSDACDYFLIHGEFRGNDITTLLQLNPDLSFNQLPSLCESGGLPDGGSNSEMTFESVCDEYRRTKNIQGQLIEEQLKMSVLEFISQCSTASKRNRRLALQEGSTEQVTFESVCEEYQRTKIFQGQIIEEQLKMSVIDFISQCQAAQKRSKRDLTNNNMEQNCIDWNEYLELNQNNLQDPIVKAVKQNYDAHCKQVKRLAGNEHGRTRRQQSDDCSLLEKRIETVRDMGDTFLEKMLVESYELKCKSNVVDPSTSGDCSEQNEALKQGIASGLSQNLIRLLRDDLEECQKNNQGGSSGSGGGSSVVVGGDCSAWEDMFDQAQQSGNEQWIEQSRKSLQQCKDAAQSGGSADGGDAGMAGLSCEDIRQLYISSDANSPVRTMLLQKNPTCLAGIEDLVDTESEGGAVSCTSFATVLASLEANPNSDPQTIEGVRKNYQQCLKDGGIDPGSQGGAVACTSFATVLASLEASSNSDPQIVEGVRQKYEQCLKDGGIDPSSQGGAASCSNFATVLSSLEANPNSDPSAIKTVRDSYEQCLEAGGIDPSSQGEGSMLANCESIANTIRLMRQDTSGGSQGGQDEASLEVIKKLQESYAECIEKGGFEIDPTDDQWGGGDTVEKMCASLSASINDLRQESELDSTQQETLQKLQSTYNSVCSSDNGGDGVEKTCASLSAAISNLKQQSTELDFAKQQDLQNFLASYNSLCSDNRGTGVFGGAVSPSSQIVLIVAEEEKMPPFISNIALPSIEAQDIQISTVYASYVKDDPQIGDMVRKTATALYNMYYTYSSFAEGNFAPGQFNLPMQITGLFGSQLIVQKQVKVEDISTHDVTVVPVDGGSHLRVTFAQDTPMTLDILDENGQPSQITTKKVTSKLPTIYVTAPFFIPARAGKRENVDAEYSFSPSSYEQEQKQLQLSGANSDPDTEKIQPVVTMFEHTQTIRFLIPLHRLGQKAIGKWTIKIAAPGDVSSENPLVGTLLVDLPPAQPLLIEKPKPKQVEDKETTDLENESDSSDDESQGTSDKRKRSSMSMPDNEFVNEDPILDEDVMDTQLGAASNNPTNDDSDSDLDTAVDPATKDDVDLTLWKQERVSTIQDYLATREREGNSRIVRVSGKIVDEKRYNAKIVQAEVTWGDWHAVLGARVEAKFECGEPAGSTTSSGNSGSSGDAASSSGTGTTTENYHTRNVVLLDNGANSDVHAGDGIYSAYFVYSGQKRCSARIVVTSSDIDNGKQDSATTITTTTHLRDLGRVTTVDMAPGVIFTRPAKQTVPSFRRELVLESFESTNKKTSSDVIPPARVIDLAVVETSLKEQRVQITFTRPKDDLDQDRLAKNPNHVLYDIRISSNLSAIYSSFNSCFQLKTEHLLLEREDMDLDGSFESPKQFSLLTVHFTVPEEVWLQSPSKVFAVALRANDTLQSGAVSNVVLVAMRDPPTTFVPVFIAALLLIALVLLSGLIYTVRRAARKSATSQGGKIYIHVPNLNKKRLSGGHSGGTKGGNRRGSGGASGGYGMGGVAGGNGGSHSIDMDMESLPKLTTTSQVCVDSY
ncbi:uncharacterized protein LOC142340535 isoform X42 [Convolutriloba macropyga]|uniref:uncharacterized protein LOC142340535 isoform X42 n=1 Tax=Convolutriloba macropyga TaxID=536237 RepID=UPI003F5272C2